MTYKNTTNYTMTELIKHEIELSGEQAQEFIEAVDQSDYIMDQRCLQIISSEQFRYSFSHIHGVSVLIEYNDTKRDYARIEFATENKSKLKGALEGLMEMTQF